MAKRTDQKEAAARGFLVDENVPAEVSEFIAAQGFRVAHIGRTEDHLLEAPPKGTPDSLLKKSLQNLVLITQDRRMLRAGAMPAKHRGLFVIDSTRSTPLAIVQDLFRKTDWTDDPLLIGRRFLVALDHLEEVEPDGRKSVEWW